MRLNDNADGDTYPTTSRIKIECDYPPSDEFIEILQTTTNEFDMVIESEIVGTDVYILVPERPNDIVLDNLRTTVYDIIDEETTVWVRRVFTEEQKDICADGFRAE